MNPEQMIEFCLKKDGAYLDYPFGPEPAIIKVCGRIFAQIYCKPTNIKVTLKCEPNRADFYRLHYKDTVIPGYHVPNMHKIYWNTVYPNRSVDDDELKDMINHSYREVVKKLQKSDRELLSKAD
jgi:predicted DNA-binding protein (MmcQ/YjbR family)